LRRITKAALGGLAGCALVLGGTQAASGLSDVLTDRLDGNLVDLDVPTTALNSAKATLKVVQNPDGTGFKLQVTDIDTTAAGKEFGAHLHVGPCQLPTDELPNPTGGHYKTNTDPASRDNEVWFDLVPNSDGIANDDTWVSFRPTDTDLNGMSVVIHVDKADVASTKQACLPVEISWAPMPVTS
jgi:Cu/Zn superoxide dismutase